MYSSPSAHRPCTVLAGTRRRIHCVVVKAPPRHGDGSPLWAPALRRGIGRRGANRITPAPTPPPPRRGTPPCPPRPPSLPPPRPQRFSLSPSWLRFRSTLLLRHVFGVTGGKAAALTYLTVDIVVIIDSIGYLTVDIVVIIDSIDIFDSRHRLDIIIIDGIDGIVSIDSIIDLRLHRPPAASSSAHGRT
ncbi:hypothetical protein RJ55_04456 [Drechmeria coniospora]|nr:hypothetical protein RJ55_04456 [Drechmeria coniospora]